MSQRMPVVAIVGRPNVGKSSLLNALAGRRISIVEDVPGVTRDRVAAPLRLDNRWIELVDTGGYGFVDPDALTEHIRQQIERAMAQADLVLLIVDAQTGLTSADEEIASALRRKGINTLLVANKADGPNADAMLGDFARLGLGTPLGVAARTGRNVPELLQAIRAGVDLSQAPTELPPPQMHLAIVGKRNAGKSTLVNAIARLHEGDADRVIVSEVPGTTRDSIDVRIARPDGSAIVVIDTAGVRKKRQMVTHDLEFYSFHRAERSVRRADVVLLLIDGVEPVSEPDRKLARYVLEQHKPVALVVTKWDLARDKVRSQRAHTAGGEPGEKELMDEYRQYLADEMPWMDFAPVAFVTANEGAGVAQAMELAEHLHRQANQRVSTGQLNRAVRQILSERTPSTPTGRRPKIYYVTQVETAPPTIVLFVNNPQFIDAGYQRFMVNRMRQLLPYSQVPIRLVIRAKEASAPAGAEEL